MSGKVSFSANVFYVNNDKKLVRQPKFYRLEVEKFLNSKISYLVDYHYIWVGFKFVLLKRKEVRHG